MIYCIDEKYYPTREDLRSEELIYKDENYLEWRIARVENGFMVKYFGDEYFKETTFKCKLKNGTTKRVKNTNCIFVKDIYFDTFYLVRDVIKTGFTDDIWDTFKEMFEERFENDLGMLESEMM